MAKTAHTSPDILQSKQRPIFGEFFMKWDDILATFLVINPKKSQFQVTTKVIQKYDEIEKGKKEKS